MRVVHRVQDNIKQLELSISDDRQKLFAKVTPQEGCQEATIADLVKDISVVAPAELHDMAVIADICDELKLNKGCDARRVAKGREPQTGRDGKVVWLVRRFNPRTTEHEEREFADFFTLGLFENIEAGTEIARIYRPSEGIPGMDVQGKELTARAGKAYTARADKSVELKNDPSHEHYTSVVAAIAGYVHDDGSLLSIRDTLQVPGNLDWSMGHIDFVGHVRVAGDVQKGFHIKARGNIDIGGGVLGENVLTSQQSISVKGFHHGFEKSSVTAKGDYSVGIANGVNADVGGNIFIGKEARDCTLRAGLGVFATNAAVIGGSIWAVKGFEAKILGNEAGVRTVIELRNELEVTREYRVLADTIQRHEAAIAALELHIGPYLKNRQRVPLLKNQFRAKMTALLDKYDEVSQSLGKLREKERAMRESKPAVDDARVNVVSQACAGVELGAGEIRLSFLEGVTGPVTYRRESQRGEWVMEKFESLKRG